MVHSGARLVIGSRGDARNTTTSRSAARRTDHCRRGSARPREPGRLFRRRRLRKSHDAITMSHGYTDVEAKAISPARPEWNTAHPDTEGERWSSTAATTTRCRRRRRLHRRQLPRRRLRVRLLGGTPWPGSPSWSTSPTGQGRAAFNWDDFYPASAQAAPRSTARWSASRRWSTTSPRLQQEAVRRRPGLPTPTNDWTWDDFRDAAKKLTDARTQTYGWAYVNDGSEDTVWRYLAMLWQAGGDLLNAGQQQARLRLPGRARPRCSSCSDMAVTDKSVYLDNGNGNYLNLFNSGQDRDALDRAVGPVEHQQRRRLRRDRSCPATTATTRPSPAPTSTCCSTTRPPACRRGADVRARG